MDTVEYKLLLPAKLKRQAEARSKEDGENLATFVRQAMIAKLTGEEYWRGRRQGLEKARQDRITE